jgi:two-component system KDP operon response regulator KdpE
MRRFLRAMLRANGYQVVEAATAREHLTPTEYKLLAALIRNAGKVVTHRQLLHDVWGANCEGQTHYLRVYMGQLRHKLERDPTRPRLLTTEPGVGYRLRDD